ncbi:hypothetical protein DYQ86_01630 [Acidobacteria bacterium AB60]|nr:hypothetical protein DYQ86_01630 [Acidobacteria bacterium AB60]
MQRSRPPKNFLGGEVLGLADAAALEHPAEHLTTGVLPQPPSRHDVNLSLRAAWRVLVSRRGLVLSIVAGALAACLVYCALAPAQYESRARLALRTTPATTLRMDAGEGSFSGSLASGQTQLETLASVFRSDQLAWRVILEERLYRQPSFSGDFARRFPGFHAERPTPEAEAYLIRRFEDRLRVSTIPRTLLLEVGFRCGDGAIAAKTVQALIRAYGVQEEEARVQATAQAADWLREQLRALKTKSVQDDERLTSFQREHGLVIAPEVLSNGSTSDVQHVSAYTALDELARELAAARAERILREAEYRAAWQGDPELVLAADPRAGQDSGDALIAVFRQIRERRSHLQEEFSQLNPERGPNYPRVVEIREELAELEKQLQTEDGRLRERYRRAWELSAQREQMLQQDLEKRTAEGLQANAAALQFEAMRREADASRELYLKAQGKAEEAGLAAGVPNPEFRVVDEPRIAAKPIAPNLLLYSAITLFVAAWVAMGMAFAVESRWPRARSPLVLLLAVVLAPATMRGQAPTPSTSGLPTGVARIPQSSDTRPMPDPRDAPPEVAPGRLTTAGAPVASLTGAVPAPIGPGDLLDVSEFHTPEFHSTVRVTAGGMIRLPLAGDVAVQGMDESQAAQAIAAALTEKGMLRHPQVHVLVIASMGQDVSVLGEVMRAGVYPYGVHHQLLDLIAAAGGTTPVAGTLAYIFHRDDPIAHAVALDRSGKDVEGASNPELRPGDTVQMSRSGLVYVVGDVMRPGGFVLDPGHPMTVLQAVSLAWGPSQNAALKKTLLIREQAGGSRTVMTLDLKRMLRGQDPDVPIGERDILFVPNSAVKNLWNRTMESVVQSTAGVSIYAGLVYSQRF